MQEVAVEAEAQVEPVDCRAAISDFVVLDGVVDAQADVVGQRHGQRDQYQPHAAQ